MTSSGHQSKAAPPHGGLGLDEILFTVFRHKRLILGFIALGIIGAISVRIIKPPPYVSKAKLMVHYVMESRGGNPTDPDAQNVHQVVGGAESIISSEVEILTSLDVATQVVATIGPEKILAKKGGGQSSMAAAGVVS